MALLGAQLKKLKENPEVLRVKRLEARIEEKLNYDGRYDVLHPMEFIMRLGSLTQEESDFFGRKKGWLEPGYAGIDWDSVPTPMLAECSLREDGTDLLRLLYPYTAGPTAASGEN